MKITLEVELFGKERRCISIYNEGGDLTASYWLNKEDDAYRIMEIAKSLIESMFRRDIVNLL